MANLADLKNFVDTRFLEQAAPALDVILAEEATVKFMNDKKIIATIPNRGGFKLFMILGEAGTNSANKTWSKKVDAFIRHLNGKYKSKFFADVVTVMRNGKPVSFATVSLTLEQARHGMNTVLQLPLLGG